MGTTNKPYTSEQVMKNLHLDDILTNQLGFTCEKSLDLVVTFAEHWTNCRVYKWLVIEGGDTTVKHDWYLTDIAMINRVRFSTSAAVVHVINLASL
jgi:hypothetical protein